MKRKAANFEPRQIGMDCKMVVLWLVLVVVAVLFVSYECHERKSYIEELQSLEGGFLNVHVRLRSKGCLGQIRTKVRVRRCSIVSNQLSGRLFWAHSASC